MKKKNKFLFVLLALCLFIPKVYAFTYGMGIDVEKTAVLVGTRTEIEVFLNNIQGTIEGIKTCSLNILFDSNIELMPKITTLENWNMITGKSYIFKTNANVIGDSKVFVVPVRVNGAGAVKLVDIVCSDGTSEVTVNDKIINFAIVDNTDFVLDGGNQSDIDNSDYNYDLLNVELSEGIINFDPTVTEYNININNFEKLEVFPQVGKGVKNYNVTKEMEEKKVIITVNSDDEELLKVYTIYVTESDVSDLDNSEEKNNNTYVPIFIGVLCVLVLINIVRIVKSIKRQ